MNRSDVSGSKFFVHALGGSVRVYTRHIKRCARAGGCSCPKWIYFNPRGGEARRISAKTTSFREACVAARKILESFELPADRILATVIPARAKAHREPKRRGRPIAEATVAMLAHAARLELDGLKAYAMTNLLLPPRPDLPKEQKAADHRRRFEVVYKALNNKNNRRRIDLEKRRIAGRIPATSPQVLPVE